MPSVDDELVFIQEEYTGPKDFNLDGTLYHIGP
jgi:hypothetical protein